MPIEILDELVDKNDAGFAVTDQKRVRGGYQVFADASDRAAFDSRKLTLGMRSFLVSDGKDYRLTSVASRTWVEIASGGGGGGITELTGDITASGSGSVTATIANGAVTDAKVALANKDGLANVPSMRTLGTGSLQAASGTDPRLSDARTPTAHAASHVDGLDPIALFDLFRVSHFGGYFAVSNANLVPTAFGAPALVELGNTQRNVAATSYLTSLQRRGYVSAATAGAAAGCRSQPILLRDFGGFRYSISFAITDASLVAGARMFAGLRAASTAPTDVQIDSVISAIGIGHEAGDVGLSIFVNDATGVASKTPLNATSFPVSTNVDVIRAEFITRLATNDFVVIVTNRTTGATQTVVVNADLPSLGVALTPTLWRSNGVTAAATGVDLFRILFDLQGGI